MKKLLFIFCGLIILFLYGCTGKDERSSISYIYADYPEYDTADDLIDAADLIFSGTVKGIKYEMIDIRANPDIGENTGINYLNPYTVFQIDADHLYKGNITDSIICIKRPGGTFGNKTYVLDGEAPIAIGSTYLFFTQTYPTSYPSLLNASQAAYDMNANTYTDSKSKITLTQLLNVLDEN